MSWNPSTSSDQPLDFSKKAQSPVYPLPLPLHYHQHSPINTESTTIPMRFFRPNEHSPSHVYQNPNQFNFMDPVSYLGGHSQFAFPLTHDRNIRKQIAKSRRRRPFTAYIRNSMNPPMGYYGSQVPISGIKQEMVRESPKVDERVEVELVSIENLSISPKDSSSESSNNSSGSRRRKSSVVSEDMKDDSYWQRRKRNNAAAKRSRDARRAKEDEIAIRAAFLEQENMRLKIELSSVQNEYDRLRHMVYHRGIVIPQNGTCLQR